MHGPSDPDDPLMRRQWWQPTERVMLDTLRTVVLISVVVSLSLLGKWGVLDAAAVTGVLGGVVGAAAQQAATAAISHRERRTDGPPDS
jgi:hypothetical protein